MIQKYLSLIKKNEKVLFDLDISAKKQTKRIVTEILKMDENNQYGQDITKALPYGCIKNKNNKKKQPYLNSTKYLVKFHMTIK